MPADHPIPVIDLFAGPGGLGEGFSSLSHTPDEPGFRIKLSIEKDPVAHRTLELRAFFRQFSHGCAPDEYYDHLRGRLSREELFSAWPSAADAARSEARRIELGKGNTAAVRKIIHDAISGEDDWVLIGGPPCQAYSKAGRSRNSYRHHNKYQKIYIPENDPRQYLYMEYLQVLADHRPAAFVMENVKGLLSATLNNQLIFDQILEDLQYPAAAIRRVGRSASTQCRSRYRIYSLEHASMFGECDLADFVVRSERHGVPQARHRVILLGVRDDVTNSTPDVLKVQLPIQARAVLAGLPRLRSGISEATDNPDVWRQQIESALQENWVRELKCDGKADVWDVVRRTVKELRLPRKDRGGEFVECEPSCELNEKWFLDKRLAGVCNHATRTHMASDLHRYLFAACFAAARDISPKLWDFPAALLPDHENVLDALDGGDFADRFRVQLWSRPATTVTSHIAKDGHYYIHPDASQCRSLTVREAARLQTFPDNYFFCGGRTAQYTQVGNAVPPLMAMEIGRIVYEVLKPR